MSSNGCWSETNGEPDVREDEIDAAGAVPELLAHDPLEHDVLLCLDYVSRPDAFARLYAKLLDGYLLDASERLDGRPARGEDLEGFLARVTRRAAQPPPVGRLGEDVRVRGDAVIGSGLEVDHVRLRGRRDPVPRNRGSRQAHAGKAFMNSVRTVSRDPELRRRKAEPLSMRRAREGGAARRRLRNRRELKRGDEHPASEQKARHLRGRYSSSPCAIRNAVMSMRS